MSDADSLPEIEIVANRIHKGIIHSLKERCPELCREDIRFATLIYAGFDSSAICLILGMEKTKVFHNRKYRLREKIISCGVPKEDPLITLLF